MNSCFFLLGSNETCPTMKYHTLVLNAIFSVIHFSSIPGNQRRFFPPFLKLKYTSFLSSNGRSRIYIVLLQISIPLSNRSRLVDALWILSLSLSLSLYMTSTPQLIESFVVIIIIIII